MKLNKAKFADLTNVNQGREPIPTAFLSEKKIAEKAPAALRALRSMGGEDLIEALGLGPYAKEN